MVKKQTRTFRVREPFQDPYVDKLWQVGEDVKESYLLKNGWKPSDIDGAAGNLLIPHLFPTDESSEEKPKGGQAAQEVEKDG